MIGKDFFRMRIARYICLSVLTLLFATIVVPAVAQHSSTAPIVQQASNAQTFLEEGKNRYQNGQFSEAVNDFQQAAQAYQTQSEPLNHALSLSYLSLAYQELGQWDEAQKAIAQSLELSQQAKDNNLVLARVLNAQGSLQLARGQTQEALNAWQEAEERYKQANDEVGRLGSQINQAQALQNLGLYRRSRSLLEQVQQQLQTQPDSSLKATGLRSLGTALQLLGDLQGSKQVLEQSLTVAKNLSNR
jgi:tetratricopeptide (TPR) repeat protein